MPYLFIVSLIWAFSPGLTKGLTTGLDPTFVAAARLGIALLVFLPFLRGKALTASLALRLASIGAVQFGVMYLAYNAAFRLLKGAPAGCLGVRHFADWRQVVIKCVLCSGIFR